MTESGKTTFARRLATRYKNNGRGVLVLDPLLDPRWNADFITDDQEHFLEVFWSNRECMAFLDEGSESVGRYDKAMQKTATRGRHWGHCCHFLCQDATQLAPIIRAQCRHLFLFCTSRKTGEKLAEEWNKDELKECGELKQGEFIHAVRFGKTQIFKPTGDKNGRVIDASRSRSRECGTVDEQQRRIEGNGEETGGGRKPEATEKG